MQYKFHRDFYNQVLESINANSVTFLLGTRKCGKTVCLKQISAAKDNARYIDFKTLRTQEEKLAAFDRMHAAIRENEDIVFLLDEITYVPYADVEIGKIANTLSDIENTRTKIVFTGSQSVALEAWANRSFAGNVGKIKVDFLTYSEFLRYKGIEEVSAESYNQFLYGAADFYHYTSLEDYLRSCLEETIISNSNSSNVIFGNDCYLLEDNIDFLINICYQTLFTLHNQTSVQTFFKDNKLYDSVISAFRETCKELPGNGLAERIERSFIGSYNSIRSKDLDVIKQAFLFLKRCDLITITPVATNIEHVPDIGTDLLVGGSINYKEELFKSYNITIKYPMFYVQILKDILGNEMPDKLPGMILGSIVECHARGLLPPGFEYHSYSIDEDGNEKEREVDYVNLAKGKAIELTIAAKHGKSFDDLPEYLEKILLTKNQSGMDSGITKLPYFDFLYRLSKCRYQTKHFNESSPSGKSSMR